MGPPPPASVVGRAIQDLAAVRLGRAFVPFALLLVVGIVRMVTSGDGLLLALGAAVSAGTMLAFAQRTVHSAFRRPYRSWMAWAAIGGLIPPAYTIWVMAWLGLRGITVAEEWGPRALGAFLAVLGTWALRSWLRLVELQRLADVMAQQLPDGQEEEG